MLLLLQEASVAAIHAGRGVLTGGAGHGGQLGLFLEEQAHPVGHRPRRGPQAPRVPADAARQRARLSGRLSCTKVCAKSVQEMSFNLPAFGQHMWVLQHVNRTRGTGRDRH